MPSTIVTTSWDDGHHIDLRLAERLSACGLKGTFYVALNHPGQKDIDDDEIRALQAMGMEIGSHTLTHRSLTGRSTEEVRHELKESKARLEDMSAHRSLRFPIRKAHSRPSLALPSPKPATSLDGRRWHSIRLAYLRRRGCRSRSISVAPRASPLRVTRCATPTLPALQTGFVLPASKPTP